MALLRFGSCVLDVDGRELSRGGKPVHLSPKAFELLKFLVSERSRALSKAELHARVWPGTFVSDDSLIGLVAELRTAIGDASRGATLLQTRHGFGYKFTDDVEELEAGPAGPPSTATAGWVVIEGRTVVSLIEGENIIGREPPARILLDSVRVSRQHARIIVSGQAAVVEDLGSRNGTFLKGKRVDGRVALADGDEISVGGAIVKFHASGRSVLTVGADSD